MNTSADRSIPRQRPRQRDRVAVVAALFLVVCFGFYWFIFPSALARGGCLLVILSALAIAFRRMRVRREPTGIADGAPASIREELAALECNLGSLRKALLQEVLPLLAGLNLFCFGLPRPGAYKGIFLAVTLVTCMGVYIVLYRRLAGTVNHLRGEVQRFER